MTTSNRVTVIVDDNAVYLDQGIFIDLDFSNCGIPEDIHALQFLNGSGEIEYRDSRHNFPITELPEWAIKCIEQWDLAKINRPNEML
jgi:hypothetical protein